MYKDARSTQVDKKINNLMSNKSQSQVVIDKDLEKRLLNAKIIAGSIGTVASIGAVVYNIKTGGGFWRGVGYFLLAGVVVSIPVHYIATAVALKKPSK
jgi:cation transporter-like permease